MGILRRLLRFVRPKTSADPIKHVIVLMLENHSFDQMLGCFKSIYPQLEGIDLANLRTNGDSTGRVYQQAESHDSIVSPDPPHELHHVLAQLKGNNGGFVSAYEKEYPATTPEQRQQIMGYYPLDFLPALHALARHFAICDHWFASVPGPTWTNRFFVHSGTSNGFVSMPESVADAQMLVQYGQDTIFDRLNAREVSWRVYFGDIPQSLVLRNQWWPSNAVRYRPIHNFFADAQEPERAFPQYCFIEPNYMMGEQDDDHPSHSTMRAQRLLGRIYNVVRKNQELWNSTLLVVLYDEHGGFYDHVVPPTAVVPDNLQEEYTFDRLGVRVPALLISPWVDRCVVDTVFDHTSLLKYLTEKWGLAPLTERVRHAQSFAHVIRTKPREDTPDQVPLPPIAMRMSATELPFGAADDVTEDELNEPLNDFQRSLLAFSEHLEQTELPGHARPKAMMTASALEESQLGKRRINAFLAKQATKFH